MQQQQGQLLSAHAHRQQIESQLETESQGLQRTQNALEEALRESASASAIEQHVKSKLATVQQTVSLQKLQLDEQHNAAARERALLEQQLLQIEESLQETQTKDVRSALLFARNPNVHYSASSHVDHRCVSFETQHTKESKTQSLSSSTHEREVVIIDKSKTSSSGMNEFNF